MNPKPSGGRADIPARTLTHLEWSALLGHLAGYAQTEEGAVRARSWPLSDSAAEAAARSEEVQEARELAARGTPVGLSAVTRLSDLLERVAKRGVLDAEGLGRVAAVLECGAAVRRQLVALKDVAPRLARRASSIRPLDDISGPIRDSFDEAGLLRDEASAELGTLRRRIRMLREEIIERLKGIMEDPATSKLLQDKYYTLRQDRYVLPVKIELRHRMKGIVHGRSQTEATVYLEPAEITELGNRLKMAVADAEMEEHRILSELTLLVGEEIPSVRNNQEILVQIDLVGSAARLSEALDGRPVEVGRSSRLLLRGARHPLMVLAGDRVVANDFVLEPAGCLVITGPNAGGKTVALKTVGLVGLMAMAGMHPPCGEGSEVPLYRGLYTSMGDEQDMAARLSTFTAHVSNLNTILRAVGPGSLTLLDEVAVGTEPTQGAALARAILEAMAESGAQVLVTTHYTALKGMAGEDPRFHNAAMGYDDALMEPTYRLEPGALGSSSALQVARGIGLPVPILERAGELLGGQQMRLDGLLQDLERKRQELEDARNAAAVDREEAEVERARAAELRKSLARELDALRRRAHDEAVTELRSLRADLERLRARLRSEPGSPGLAREAERLASAAAERLSDLAPSRSDRPGTRPARPDEVAPGTEVVVAATGAAGTVVEVMTRGRVTVQVGTVKLKLRATDLLVPVGEGPGTEPRAKKRRARKAPAESGPAPEPGPLPDEPLPRPAEEAVFVRDPEATLDLRGLRVEEALDELDRFLDRMLHKGTPSVLVIHGYGTGALRKSVRDHMDENPAVHNHRPGKRSEGGDGVTVAFLDV